MSIVRPISFMLYATQVTPTDTRSQPAAAHGAGHVYFIYTLQVSYALPYAFPFFGFTGEVRAAYGARRRLRSDAYRPGPGMRMAR